MQIVVLGMHRSGTSMVARLLNMAGVYFGGEGASLGSSEQNRKGFWERRDVRKINDTILRSLGCDWDQLEGFDLARLQESARAAVKREIRDVVLNLEPHRPWMIKEPRLCLTLPVWASSLELPVAVVVRRHPLEVADSLRSRNGFPLSLGLALWESYTIHLLRNLGDLPVVFVDHQALLAEPGPAFSRLLEALGRFGISGLRMPADPELTAFVDSTLYRARLENGLSSLDGPQRELWEYFAGLDSGRVSPGDFRVSANAARDIAAHQGFAKAFAGKLQGTVLAAQNAMTAEAAAKGEIAEMRKQVAELQESQVICLERAAALRARSQAERMERMRLKRSAADNEAKLKAQSDQAISELHARIQEHLALEDKLRGQIRKLQTRASDLENVVKKRDKKIEMMRSGFSWRITAPLRWVGHLVCKIFTGSAKISVSSRVHPKQAAKARVQHAPEVEEPVPVLPPGSMEVDIIVCVHNALEDVRSCLESLARTRTDASSIILVNDGSNAETSAFLSGFAADHERVKLLSSETPRGYTKAANHGLRESKASSVIFLNSDTITPPGWIERLLACAFSSPKIGLVGPVSNSATWQSVPRVRSGRGGWALNRLPAGCGVEDLARITSQMSDKSYPRVPLLNGFCLLVKREVFDRIGVFDEEGFPKGYGEENDFCLRAGKAGYELAVADDCYVYHAKSKSYSSAGRDQLVAEAKKVLEERYGGSLFKKAAAQLSSNPQLAQLRSRIAAAVERRPPWPERFSEGSLRILFLLPCMGRGGGVLSVLQESYGMVRRGVEARVAVYRKHLEEYLEHFADYPTQLFVPFETAEDLARLAQGCNVVVGTIYTSIALLKDLATRCPGVLPAYYVQDYEPFFFEEGSAACREARESYTAIDGLVRFAKTDWICEIVQAREGAEVGKVTASVDHGIFHPRAVPNRKQDCMSICAMVRPQTPRRSAGPTIEVLRRLSSRMGDAIRITIFGCEDSETRDLRIDFPCVNRGVLTREEVAELLREQDVFLDMSAYQAFGRTAIEAMASGCVAVVPAKSGAEEFARHLENALVVDTSNVEGVAEQIGTTLSDSALLEKLKRNGIETAGRYTVAAAVESMLELFQNALRERTGKATPN